MGDMKTPDFDDLLAAFDIPDIDANEAIHSHHEEPEPHGKQLPGEPGPAGAPEHVLPHPDISAVSVIVKNTVCPEQLEGKDAALAPRLLQNGFGAAAEGLRSPGARLAEAASNGECWAKEKGSKALDLFSHFSPEPGEDGANLIDRARECKAKEKSLAVPSLAASPTPPGDCKEPLGEGAESLEPAFPAPFRAGAAGDGAHPVACIKKEESDSEEAPGRGCSPKGLVLDHLKSVTVRYSAEDSPVVAWPGAEPAALDAGASAGAELKRSPGSPRESFSSPGIPIPPSPKQLSLKEEREMLGKSVGSPPSVSSGEEEEEEEESTNSPSSSSSRPLKVRIKTIKTSCGSITRTVTRVSSDSEPPSTKVPSEQDSQEPLECPAGIASEAAAKEKSELSSPLKNTEGPKIVSVQLGNGTKLKGTVLPVATIQSASSAMLIAASVAQQKSVVLPGKAGKSVAKNILSLVPQPLPKGDGRPNGSAKANGGAAPPKAAPGVAGTVISRSQSSLVEAFNKILNSKNLLPTYKPNLSPPAESSLALPPSGYRCLECGDAFALEKSLARHYDRRSMRIEVTCNHCTKRLVFFNKCSLLLHAREHKDKGLVMQCSHLVMRPIALEQMIGQPDITPLVSLALPAGKVAQEGGGAAQELPVLPLGSEQSSYSCFRCLECKEQCKDKAGLAAHFQQVGVATSSSSTVCSACPMILANRCSFSAHQRMHRSRPPHVCPECGGNFLLANFEAHLKESCLHFSRRVGYRCPSCSVVFGGVNSIKSHIQSSHCEVFHKCPICPMAFKSAPSAHAHVYTQHPGFSNQQSKMIYKCAMCDTVFTHKPLLSSHFDQHLLPQRVSVFRCPQCPLLFAQKRTMLEHLKNTHQPQKSKDEPSRRAGALLTPKAEPLEPPGPRRSESSSSSSEEEEEAPSSPELRRARRSRFPRKAGPKAKGSGWTCGVCHSWFPERDEYVAHMKREHGKSVKKFPCHLCERSFCSAPSLRRHVRVNHEGIKRVYPCRYCTEGKRTFSSRLILEKHIQVRHGIKVTDPARSQEVVMARGPSGPAQAPGRKRKLSSDESCSEEPDSTTPPAKSPKPCGAKAPFRCRKCGFLAGSRAEFQAHIPQHRTDGNSQQCRECGLCFTSQISLNRHRFISHKKKKGAEPEEPSGGAAQGSGSGAGPGGNSGGGSEGKLECKVCGRGFESQLNLKTHFRTHGMAFIRARQGAEEN
ncbi:LOW QUALITY PROTEIN: zinc finger protein 687 [Haemorhous mexicanus]|uniref:LOW QUALITY PROTEIN: zinc finger protein 687 n=1 Tax=Haemorhous mexicanus TaxID=30427 RepID=UPI0028BDCD44|nr:LOW QUALITY PROTEIN: zinc finger protein 687 [Haemorhous mexicanus]